MLEKAACYIKNIWIFSVRQRIKSTNWHCQKQYRKLDDTSEFDEIIKIEELTIVKL